MTDEDKRMLREEKERREKEEKMIEKLKQEKTENDENKHIEEIPTKRKVAEITGVDFLDKDKESRSHFKTGEDIYVRVYFKNNDGLEKINFGLAIFNQLNNYLIGINSFLDKKNTDEYVKKGYFEVLYPKNIFAKGIYRIEVGMWGEEKDTLIDYMSQSKKFGIRSDNPNDGIIEVDYKWN